MAGSDGVADVLVEDSVISLMDGSTNYIGNRAIVMHGGQDDLGQGGDIGSTKYGNAGPRVACGIIEQLNEN